MNRSALFLLISLNLFQSQQIQALTPGQKIFKAFCALTCFELITLGTSFYLSPSNWTPEQIDCNLLRENFNFSCDIVYPYLNILRNIQVLAIIAGSLKFGSDFLFLDLNSGNRRNIFDSLHLA